MSNEQNTPAVVPDDAKFATVPEGWNDWLAKLKEKGISRLPLVVVNVPYHPMQSKLPQGLPDTERDQLIEDVKAIHRWIIIDDESVNASISKAILFCIEKSGAIELNKAHQAIDTDKKPKALRSYCEKGLHYIPAELHGLLYKPANGPDKPLAVTTKGYFHLLSESAVKKDGKATRKQTKADADNMKATITKANQLLTLGVMSREDVLQLIPTEYHDQIAEPTDNPTDDTDE